MSASREKKTRQDQVSSGWTDPKTAREAQQRKEQKRSNILYGVIAIVFVIVAITSIIWRSNIIPKSATAVTINGEKYNAAEVDFYYQNVYQSFYSNYYYYMAYGMISLNTSADLKSQVMTESDAAMLGLEAEEGRTWHDFFLEQALDQMASVQAGLDAAKAEGFTYPASVQAQYDDSLASLEATAAASNLSVDQYLQNSLGSSMTAKVYKTQLMRMLQYDAYSSAYSDSLTYTDDELETAYQADTNSYDRVSYESVSISGAAESTTDADGNEIAINQGKTWVCIVQDTKKDDTSFQ